MSQKMKCKSCQRECRRSNAGRKNGQLACPHCGKTKLKTIYDNPGASDF